MITLFLIAGIVLLIVIVPFIPLLIKDLKQVERKEEFYRKVFGRDLSQELFIKLMMLIAFASIGALFTLIGAYPQTIITAYNILKSWIPMIGISCTR
ncbi:MAG: hypothetical protein GXO26_07825 [Crenarchaeota archaeon]|nr:hypothetical protein [Thermoproteota archaeon]